MIVKIGDLKENKDNPRTIDDNKLKEIKKSIQEFPEMLSIRPIIVNSDFVILGGNMRYKALVELGYTEVEVLVMDREDKEYDFLIKDNMAYGDWSWVNLTDDYKSNDLVEWGLDIPLWYRDIEKSIEKNDKEPVEKKPVEKKPKSENKALYIFLKPEEKDLFIITKNVHFGDKTNEEMVMELIRKELNNG